MDETHLIAAARYIALNPVRARLVGRPQDWAWSSARAHLSGRDDELVKVRPLLDRVGQAGPGIRVGLRMEAEPLALRRGDEVAILGEVVVDREALDPGDAGDLGHGGGARADGAMEFHRRVDDAFPGGGGGFGALAESIGPAH